MFYGSIMIPVPACPSPQSYVTCPKCGAKAPASHNYCFNCGAALHEPFVLKICPNCKSRIAESARFCPECGSKQS